jgi:Berberine and berberine like
MRPFITGSDYVNQIGLEKDEGSERIKAAYGTNYERLVAVKNKYDPTNLFRHILVKGERPEGGVPGGVGKVFGARSYLVALSRAGFGKQVNESLTGPSAPSGVGQNECRCRLRLQPGEVRARSRVRLMSPRRLPSAGPTGRARGDPGYDKASRPARSRE